MALPVKSRKVATSVERRPAVHREAVGTWQWTTPRTEPASDSRGGRRPQNGKREDRV
jgi:hypothetical protein